MIHARVRTADGGFLVDPPVDQLPGLLKDPATLSWLDLESPTEDELGLLSGILEWDPLTEEDLTSEDQRTKLERFDTYDVLVMHALQYVPPDSSGVPRVNAPEVDFVIGKNYVTSVHYCPLPHMTETRETTNHYEKLLNDGPDYILYVLIDNLVDSYFPVVDAMQDAVDELEDEIVTNPSDKLLPIIFEMKRDAVRMRKAISPQLEVFARLTAPGYGVVSEEHVNYFRDVHDHLIRVFEASDSYRELMGGALDAYLSTVSNRMNDVMKRLTVVAALFLPITFLTGLLGMNLRSTPPWDDNFFWVFLAGMA
ncbi:MAG: magnesium transporter CorA family protein, partial [Tepidiformaceae bacterium]